MSENIEKWIGGVDEKLKDISEDLKDIKIELKTMNGRTGKVEVDVAVLKINNEKNCKSITSLWKRVNASKLTMKDKIAIVVAFITGIFAIIIVVIPLVII